MIEPKVKSSLPVENPFIQFLLNCDWKLISNNRFICDEFILEYVKDISIIESARRINIPNMESIEDWERYILSKGFYTKLHSTIIANRGRKLLESYTDSVTVDQLLHFEVLHADTYNESSFTLMKRVNVAQQNLLMTALRKPVMSKKDLSDEINIYMALNRYIKVFVSTNPYFSGKSKAQLELLVKIQKDFAATLLSADEKVEILEKLLFTEVQNLSYKSISASLGYQPVLLSEIYKVFFVDEYVKAITEIASRYAKHPADYENKITALIDKVLKGANPEISKRILTQFADGILAQRNTSNYIKSSLDKKMKNAGLDNYGSLEILYKLINAITAFSSAKDGRPMIKLDCIC